MLFKELILTLEKLDAGLLEYDLGGNPELSGGASLEKAAENQISFLEEGNSLKSQLQSSKVGAVLLPKSQELKIIAKSNGIAWAIFTDPRFAFAESLDLLSPKKIYENKVHPSSFIGSNVLIEDNVYIGPNASIGDNTEIGANSIIHAGVVLYENVKIGKQCELHSNCVVHPNSILGDRCIIHSSAVVGSEGFGFVPTKSGWRKMPQTGVAILESNVEIGSGSTIDRPSVGETRIKRGTKIDNLVQIGHGVTIGRNCAMASQVGIAGGAIIGDGVILAGQVGVGNRVTVGEKVIASSKTGIHTDIPANQVISGFPAMPNRLWLKCSANFKKLPEIAKAMRRITKH